MSSARLAPTSTSRISAESRSCRCRHARSRSASGARHESSRAACHAAKCSSNEVTTDWVCGASTSAKRVTTESRVSGDHTASTSRSAPSQGSGSPESQAAPTTTVIATNPEAIAGRGSRSAAPSSARATACIEGQRAAGSLCMPRKHTASTRRGTLRPRAGGSICRNHFLRTSSSRDFHENGNTPYRAWYSDKHSAY